MLLEPKVAPHCGLPRVLRLKVLDLDNESFAFLLVLIPESDNLIVVPVLVGQQITTPCSG